MVVVRFHSLLEIDICKANVTKLNINIVGGSHNIALIIDMSSSCRDKDWCTVPWHLSGNPSRWSHDGLDDQ